MRSVAQHDVEVFARSAFDWIEGTKGPNFMVLRCAKVEGERMHADASVHLMDEEGGEADLLSGWGV